MNSLHPDFCENMRHQLGKEADAYFSCLENAPQRGIRLNPLKKASETADGVLDPIPWADGYYLTAESTAGSDPLHEAGAWYLQEPSAMISAPLIQARPGEIILDLCSAPGGKATQIGAAMAGKGLLVCNEPVPGRAKILSRNIERMGITNAVVVSELPEKLASQWPELFDAILVDAPCSGEGMFRRHPETRTEWEPGSPEGCAERQKHILKSAVSMLRGGGRLVYSTCTFNTVENENVCGWLESLGMIPDAFSVMGNSGILEAPDGRLHLYPHQIRGEGHFAARFRKPGDSCGQSLLRPAGEVLTHPSKEMLSAFKMLSGFSTGIPNACLGDSLLSCPELPPLKGIRVLRAGLQLGQLKGKIFQPDHALALAQYTPLNCPHVTLNREEAIRYQRGEVLQVPEELKGYVLAEYAGVALGFGKASEGQLKNHYPKGLRKG